MTIPYSGNLIRKIPIPQNGSRRKMDKNPQEWLKQADYDMETAEIMFDNKRHIYKDYNTAKTRVLLEKSKEALKWLKARL